MSISRQYVPWYRRGFGTALVGAPAAGASRAAMPASIGLTGVTTTTALPIELAGPGDVVGLDPREILRCEPYDGCPDVEPGYFPYVELASTDLPWRFTPVGPAEVTLADPEHAGASTVGTRLPPWLALVVVPADRATLAPAAAGGLPVLTTTGDQLPPPGESWAWAHVQVSFDSTGGAATDADLTAGLADPSRCVTRIVCPRRLDAATRYGAYLVPTFAAGRAVLDPAAVGADPLAPAWTATGNVDLPVYFGWSFSTSAEGTFESVVRRLRPRHAPAEAAGRSIDTAAPGWAATAVPDRTTLMQGALRPLESDEPAADPALAESLRLAVSSAGADVELRPPVYGQDHQSGVTAVASSTDGWLGQLNTDPRRRLAAGLAAWAVAVEQEELADDAWQQLADSGLANVATAATQDLAALVASSLAVRHQPATGIAPTALRMARRRPTALARGRVSRRSVTPTPAAPAPTTFAPTFTQPAYRMLRAVAPEWLLPGVESVPLDSVVLMRSNAAFVESYLVGLNHAMAQELVWRGYPLDRAATMFTRFWGLAGGTDDTSIGGWDPASDLGSHLGGGDELVLLIRGSFVARFPTAVIYLSRDAADGSETTLMPNLSGTIGLDATFIGFPLTTTAVEAPVTDGGGPWRIVLQESVDSARFGVDDTPATGTGTLASWQDLDWGNPGIFGSDHLVVVGPLLGVTRPTSAGSAEEATWGASAGHLASALQQPAFRVRIPLSLWLTPATEA